MLNSRKHGEQQASTIQSRPVKKTRKVGKNGSRMRQTALIYLHVTARLQLIHCFKRRTSHELNFNTQFQLTSFLRVVKYNFNIQIQAQKL